MIAAPDVTLQTFLRLKADLALQMVRTLGILLTSLAVNYDRDTWLRRYVRCVTSPPGKKIAMKLVGEMRWNSACSRDSI
jgi:hypothetical protein